MKRILIFAAAFLIPSFCSAGGKLGVEWSSMTNIKDTSAYIVSSREYTSKLNLRGELVYAVFNAKDNSITPLNIPQPFQINIARYSYCGNNEITSVQYKGATAFIVEGVIEDVNAVDAKIAAKTSAAPKTNLSKTNSIVNAGQLFIVNMKGKIEANVLPDNVTVKTWKHDEKTNKIIVLAKEDTDKNKKFNKDDKTKIYIFDLTGKEPLKEVESD